MKATENQVARDEKLASYCGFYCGACPTYVAKKCAGCRGDLPQCAVGYRKCRVRACCADHSYVTCADCKEYESAKQCKKYNPLPIKLGEFLSGTSRGKAIELIKQKGLEEFVEYMVGKEWVTVKTKDTFLNKKLGKRKN